MFSTPKYCRDKTGYQPRRERMDTTHLDPAVPRPKTPADGHDEPRILGDYRILRRLGEGGMGSVYLGYHEGEKKQVAIKILAGHLANNQGFIARFYREARSNGALDHPNIVRGIGVGKDRVTDKPYLVMEYVDGFSAHALLDTSGRLAVGDAVHIALDVARALEHAHSRNIVHRDIKPDNILISRSGVAKLTDFGLAKRTDEASHLTAARQGFGTSYYMPYEQANDAKLADGRSDIYALGATLYHLLTAEVPFSGDNHLEIIEKKGRGDYIPASLLNPAVPPALDLIIDKMLAREPIDRYQTASDLIVDLERSRLVSSLPSFADPDLALQDPWMRACLTSVAQPTRPDLEAVSSQQTPIDTSPNSWRVRYRNKKGKWCQVRGTTKQIADRLRKGRMPAGVEVCRADEKTFRPVAEHSEFAAIKPIKRGKPASLKKPSNKPMAAPSSTRSSRPRWHLYAGAGAGFVLFLSLAIAFYYFLVRGT